ncbi:uncharacterized protein ACBT57_001663 isoform 11-T34 [Dama dama]
MATYPPRRLLGARPLPSDPRRDPRRSDFPPGGGGRWERRLRTGQSWGWVDCFSRVGEGTRRGASPLRFPPRGPHLLSHQLTGRLVATPQPLHFLPSDPETSGACARASRDKQHVTITF